MRVKVGRPPFLGGSSSPLGGVDDSDCASDLPGTADKVGGDDSSETDTGTEPRTGAAGAGVSAAVAFTSNAIPCPFSLA